MSPANRPARLVVVDCVVIDVVVNVDALPRRGGDVIAGSSGAYAAGAFNVMAASSRMGLGTVYGGVLGTGPFASIARSALDASGIACALDPVLERDTGFVVAMVEPDGERTFLTSTGAEATLSAAQLERIPLGERDLVYFSGYALLHESNRTAVLSLIDSLAEATTLLFDPGPLIGEIPSDALTRVLGRSDWVSCTAREAALLGAASPLEAASELLALTGRRGVIVRTGPDGCVIAQRDAVARSIPGFPVSAVDTNGAGDCHVGVFAALLARGHDPVEATETANAAAALSVTKRGPATCPSHEELYEFLTLHQDT